MYQFLNNQTFLHKRRNCEHYFFGNINNNDSLPSLEWSDFINCLNYSVHEKKSMKILSGCRYIMHDHSSIPSIQSLVESLAKLDPNVECSAHIYMHLASTSDGFGSHTDTSDVWFWQVIGSTSWSVIGDRIYRYILNPGDLIYIPRGMPHDVKSITPRVGISFGLDYNLF